MVKRTYLVAEGPITPTECLAEHSAKLLAQATSVVRV